MISKRWYKSLRTRIPAGQKWASPVLASLFLVGLVLLSACGGLPTPTPVAAVPGLVNTLAAQTLAADPKVIAAMQSLTPPPPPATPKETATPEATPTPLPAVGPPTYTPFPTLFPELATQSALSDSLTAKVYPTDFAPPTPDPNAMLPDGSLAPCNALEFVRDVTVPDEMLVHPGEKFTKIWELKNIGACTWTPDYTLVLVWGNEMGTHSPIKIKKFVLPGESAEFSLNMKAPYIPSCFQGNWMLQSPDGERFGHGFKFRQAFWVAVSVSLPGLNRWVHT